MSGGQTEIAHAGAGQPAAFITDQSLEDWRAKHEDRQIRALNRARDRVTPDDRCVTCRKQFQFSQRGTLYANQRIVYLPKSDAFRHEQCQRRALGESKQQPGY